METVGERVRDLRTRAKLERKELARLAGLSQSLIGHIERGTREQPSAKTLQNLARVFGTDFAFLFAGEGKAPSERSLRRAVDEARAQNPEAA